MLGYLTIYAGRLAGRFRSQPDQRRSWWTGMLPHEIAALNAR